MAALSMGHRADTTLTQDREMMDRAVRTVARSDDPLAHATVLALRITLLGLAGDPLAWDLLADLPVTARTATSCARWPGPCTTSPTPPSCSARTTGPAPRCTRPRS